MNKRTSSDLGITYTRSQQKKGTTYTRWWSFLKKKKKKKHLSINEIVYMLYMSRPKPKRVQSVRKTSQKYL